MKFHIDHINLTIKNLTETANWYERVFDMKIVEEGLREDGNKWAVIGNGDYFICMNEFPKRKNANTNYEGANPSQNIYHFGFRITDRSEWEKRVRENNLALYYGGVNEYPHSTSWYVNDPTGYEIEVAVWDQNAPSFKHAKASL